MPSKDSKSIADETTTQSSPSKLNKIVYFDEGSATDLIQIFHGGGLKRTFELFDTDEDAGKAHIDSEGKIGLGKIFQEMIGMGASTEVGASMSTSYSSNQVAKNILTNTVLTDFLECVAGDGSGVKCLEGYEISTIDNAMSSMMLITPYLTMLRSRKGMRAGDFDVSLERIDDVIRKAKGYNEFLAKKHGEKPIILRFNHGSFKNNYKLPDLLRMNLVIYAVRVGASSLDALNIEKELNFSSFDNVKNPSYPVPFKGNTDVSKEVPLPQKEPVYEMFDVILAGVKGHA